LLPKFNLPMVSPTATVVRLVIEIAAHAASTRQL